MSSEPADKRSKMAVTLGYWDIRGLAQPIRLLLKYTGTDFEDVRYSRGDDSSSSWPSVKYTLGLDFPNLPYLFDGDIKISQSNAILSHLGRKNNLSGKDEAERALVDMLAAEAMDFRNGFVRVTYNPNMASMKADYLKNVADKIQKYSTYLGNKPWFAGNEITYVDFPFYELLDQHRLFEPSLFNGLDNLKEYMDRFEAVPAIKEYMASSEFISWPVNNPTARWGGEKKDSA